MTVNSLYFQLSSQFLLSGQFIVYNEDEMDENKFNFGYNNAYNNNKLNENLLLFIITKLLEFLKKRKINFKRINLINFNIENLKDKIFELIIELIKNYKVTELIFDFTSFSEKQEFLFKSILKNLTFVRAKKMSPNFINLFLENSLQHNLQNNNNLQNNTLQNHNLQNHNLEHLYINYLPNNFTNYNILKNLKTFEFILQLTDQNNQNFYNFFTKGLINMKINFNINLDFIKSFENCKNLKKFTINCYQTFTTINWDLPKKEESIVNYLNNIETFFPNLKELKLNFKASENSQHFLKYFIKKNINLEKFTINYLNFINLFILIERIDKINELKILKSSINNFENFKTLQKKIKVNKLIIQSNLNLEHLQFLNNLQIKEIRFVNSIIDNNNLNNFYLENLNKLKTIYLYNSKIFIPILEELIKKSENNLTNLIILKSELISNNLQNNLQNNLENNLQKLKDETLQKTIQNEELKELKKLKILKIENCKNDYALFYLFLLQYKLPNLEKYLINNCYNITKFRKIFN
ncbi:hypothetical protein ABK040_007584 [Willaertia magna]